MEIVSAKRKAPRPVGRPRVYVSPLLILNLRQQGLSFRQIAAVTGFGYGTVRRAYHNIELSTNVGHYQ